MSSEKKEDSLFPSFKKRKLQKGKPTIKKVHKRVIAPPGQ